MRSLYVWIGLAVLVAVYAGWCLFRPLPDLQPTVPPPKMSNQAEPTIKWSSYGVQAVGATDNGVMATHGSQKARPIASVAKTMVALSVLKQKPLADGEPGDKITFTAEDEALYKKLYSENNSVVAVKAGESLTQLQALQGMLIGSGNNLAIKLAETTFGSVEAYTEFANKYAKELGMTSTHFADASGFNPETVSSPSDLVKMGLAATQNPVIAKIVKMQKVTLPVAGLVNTYNTDLGTTKLNGIKTGSTDQAGGNFLFSMPYKGTTLVGAIVHAPDRGTALYEAPLLMNDFASKLAIKTPVRTNQVVGYYMLPWGGKVNIVAQKDLSVLTWAGSEPEVTANLSATSAKTTGGTKVGSISYQTGENSQTTTAVLSQDIPKPGILWRVLHPKS